MLIRGVSRGEGGIIIGSRVRGRSGGNEANVGDRWGVMRWTDRHVKLGDRRVIERVKCAVSRVKW